MRLIQWHITLLILQSTINVLNACHLTNSPKRATRKISAPYDFLQWNIVYYSCRTLQWVCWLQIKELLTIGCWFLPDFYVVGTRWILRRCMKSLCLFSYNNICYFIICKIMKIMLKIMLKIIIIKNTNNNNLHFFWTNTIHEIIIVNNSSKPSMQLTNDEIICGEF